MTQDAEVGEREIGRCYLLASKTGEGPQGKDVTTEAGKGKEELLP